MNTTTTFATLTIEPVTTDPNELGAGLVLATLTYACPDLLVKTGHLWSLPDGQDVRNAIRDMVIAHDRDRFTLGLPPCSCCVGIWRRYVEGAHS